MRVNILSVGFDNVTLEEASEIGMEYIRTGKKAMVVTPNAEIGLECLKTPQLNDLVNSAQLVLPDGVGVVYAAKILKKHIKGKVAGVDFAEELVKNMAREKRSLFLFGGKPGVAEQAASRLSQKYPGLVIAGALNGYFDDEEPIIEQINKSVADALFVCLGCPKQEYFMHRNFERLNVKLMAGLGGSLDIFSGNSQRAPDIFVKLGLEWFYRLAKEPKRIKRMARLPLYLVYALKSKYKGEKQDA